MPELPDITVYIEALEARIVGQTLERVRLASPFLLRTIEPPLSAAQGKKVRALRRVGKRIAIGLEDDLWLVLHLMIAGRLHWRAHGAKIARKNTPAAFDFSNGSLVLTEAGSQKRASLHVVSGADNLRALDPGGIDVLDAGFAEFSAALTSANHTLKRALTDPRTFSGIGNAYSDEILHRARLSPIALTQKLTHEEIQRLYDATKATLADWVDRLRAEAKGEFPEKVTAFRAKAWPYTAAMESRVRRAAPKCSASATRRMKPTTVRDARPAAACWPIAHCPGCYARIGRAR